MRNEWDIIVIGSGMGGMVTAAALSRMGHKVLMLEQYDKLGGQTHSFSREGFSWDAGLHYLGGFGPDESERATMSLTSFLHPRVSLPVFGLKTLIPSGSSLGEHSNSRCGVRNDGR